MKINFVGFKNRPAWNLDFRLGKTYYYWYLLPKHIFILSFIIGMVLGSSVVMFMFLKGVL